MNKLPIKFFILREFKNEKTYSNIQILDNIKDIYGREKQCNIRVITDHILSLKANGLLDEVDYNFNKKGEIEVFYKISDEGKDMINKYDLI